MTETKTIEFLTTDSVTIITKRFVTIDGQTYQLGQAHAAGYVNSPTGRKSLAAEVPEPYLSAVVAVWGDTATIEDPVTKGVPV